VANTPERIVAMIPARRGSVRLPIKNLALIDGKPLIYYAIQAAKDSGLFDRIVINSEDLLFQQIAKRYGIEFYQRPPELATDTARSDDVVYDFMKANPCDILVWVNPITPLQTGQEIKGVVHHFTRSRLDSLITVKDEKVHCQYQGRPINFNKDEIFSRTQDLEPVQTFVYSIMMWRVTAFMCNFEEKGHALFCGKSGVYPVSKSSAVLVKRKEDLWIAEALLAVTRRAEHDNEVRYDEVLKPVER